MDPMHDEEMSVLGKRRTTHGQANGIDLKHGKEEMSVRGKR